MATLGFLAIIGLRFFTNNEDLDSKKGVDIRVHAIKDVVLIQDKNLKTWSVLDHDTKISPDITIAAYGENSGLLLALKKDLLLGLNKDSSIRISVDKDGKEDVQLLYGCFGVKEPNKEPVFKCSQKQETFSFISPTEIYETQTIQNMPISPCGEILEAMPGEDSAVVTLNSSGLKSSLKLFQVASDVDFKNIVFESKTYWNFVKTNPLKVGKYYWRLKDSRVCNFEINKKSILNVLKPQNQEVVSDSAIEFEWDIESDSSKNTLVILSANSGAVQSVEVKGNKFVIDDPLQTLGPGAYFWYFKDQKEKSSTPRSFYVITSQDIVLETPIKSGVVDEKQKFIPIIWKPMVGVKSYGVSISSSPSFVSMDYANTSEEPFVFVPMLKEGDYFLRISALFDNSKKIATEAISFSVKKQD
jgi:hypothetical protein